MGFLNSIGKEKTNRKEKHMNRPWRKGFLKAKICNERGSMLVMSLLVSALFVTFSAGYLGLLAVEARNTEKAHRSNLALHVAESGVEEAIWEISYNNKTFASANGWSGTNPKTKTSSLTTSSGKNLGSYTVTVTDPTGTAPVVSSTGSALYQSSTLAESRTVKVALIAPSSQTYTRAVFVSRLVEMYSTSCTDSFDSRNGPYSVTNKGTDGDVGTNSTAGGQIHMYSNSMIKGDAVVGVGGEPNTVIQKSETASISGTKSALSSEVIIPSIPAPTGLTVMGSLNYDDNSDHPISSSGQYTNFVINGNSSVTISGNTKIFVTGEFRMDSNAELNIAGNVELYVEGSFLANSNTTINNLTQDPTKLKIYGIDALVDHGDTAGIRLFSNTVTYATVHAKNSTVDLNSNAGIYGAVMAKNVYMRSNSCVHYDVALGAAGSSGSIAAVSTWQEK